MTTRLVLLPTLALAFATGGCGEPLNQSVPTGSGSSTSYTGTGAFSGTGGIIGTGGFGGEGGIGGTGGFGGEGGIGGTGGFGGTGGTGGTGGGAGNQHCTQCEIFSDCTDLGIYWCQGDACDCVDGTCVLSEFGFVCEDPVCEVGAVCMYPEYCAAQCYYDYDDLFVGDPDYCQDSYFSRCLPSGRCRQCTSNADCADQTMTRCNTISNLCELCSDDGECNSGLGDRCGGDGRCTCASGEECWSDYTLGICQ